jgi:ABC-type antimicrobial peptide transport system permease subunit
VTCALQRGFVDVFCYDTLRDMKVTQYFLMAFEGMLQHKLRTLLTLLGLIVGISSVLVMTGIGRGFGQETEEQFASLLPNKITVQQGYSPDAPPAALTLRDVEVLRRLVGQGPIRAVAPQIDLYDLQLKGIDITQQPVQVIATSADYVQTIKPVFSWGRFFSDAEERSGDLVAVINTSMLSVLQSNSPQQTQPPLLTVNNLPFRIVGVLDDTGNPFTQGLLQAFIPISLLQKSLRSQSVSWQDGYMQVSQIFVVANDVAQLEPAKRAAERLLRLGRGLRADQANNFELVVEGQFLEFAQNFTRGFTLVLAGIGAISLLVGGIGIMNILLATVAERTREIGVRKAIGASDMDILSQFLIESVTICLLGGTLGVGLSYGIGRIIDYFSTPESMIGLRVVIDLRSVAIATLSSVVCGLVFGLYPALRAMRLDPIQALRYE